MLETTSVYLFSVVMSIMALALSHFWATILPQKEEVDFETGEQCLYPANYPTHIYCNVPQNTVAKCRTVS